MAYACMPAAMLTWKHDFHRHRAIPDPPAQSGLSSSIITQQAARGAHEHGVRFITDIHATIHACRDKHVLAQHADGQGPGCT